MSAVHLPHRVVILGGGYVTVWAYRSLAKHLKAELREGRVARASREPRPGVQEDRRHARVRHIRLVLDDARRATAQPADVEAIADEAATALRALGVDPSEVPAERRA